MAVSEEEAMHTNGLEMGIWNILDVDPDRFPKLCCTKAVVVDVVRHECLWRLILTVAVRYGSLR